MFCSSLQPACLYMCQFNCAWELLRGPPKKGSERYNKKRRRKYPKKQKHYKHTINLCIFPFFLSATLSVTSTCAKGCPTPRAAPRAAKTRTKLLRALRHHLKKARNPGKKPPNYAGIPMEYEDKSNLSVSESTVTILSSTDWLKGKPKKESLDLPIR